MTKVFQSGAARRDLVEHFIYLAENADAEIAERFLHLLGVGVAGGADVRLAFAAVFVADDIDDVVPLAR